MKKEESLKDKENYTNTCAGVTPVFKSWSEESLCDACGAYAPTPEEVEHFIHCPLKED